MKIGCIGGHGGPSNRGCFIRSYGDEADYTLLMSRKLHAALPGSVLLRPYDQTLSLKERGQLAKANQCDVVISLHVNAVPGNGLYGFSAWHWPGNARMQKLGKRILTLIPPELRVKRFDGTRSCRSLVSAIDERHIDDDKRWRMRGRAVLGCYPCDTLLLELGFGATDYLALLDTTIQDNLCLAIERAVGEQYNGINGQHVTS